MNMSHGLEVNRVPSTIFLDEITRQTFMDGKHPLTTNGQSLIDFIVEHWPEIIKAAVERHGIVNLTES